jgi:hypothetical protein
MKSRGTSLYFRRKLMKEVPLGAGKDIADPTLP